MHLVPRKIRRGSVLVEFALISFVLYLLLAATLEFGRIFYSAQSAQTAADVAARELSKVPLPPTATFDQFLFPQPGEDASFTAARKRVYDRGYLVLPLDDDDITEPLPVVNQLLKTLMVVDSLPDGTRVRRYPGQLVPLVGSPLGYTVVVPILGADSDIVEVREVLEEIHPAGATEGPFSLTAPAPNAVESRGTVALRVNYPYQAATLTAYKPNAADVPGEPPNPNVDPSNALPADSPRDGLGDDVGPNAGTAGLGRLYAMGKEVRPFRKVLTGQAFARRELFQ